MHFAEDRLEIVGQLKEDFLEESCIPQKHNQYPVPFSTSL